MNLRSPTISQHKTGESALGLYAQLAREAITTESPRAFGLKAAQAAAAALGASHCGVSEILADGARLSVQIHPLAGSFSAATSKYDVPLTAEGSLSAAALRLGRTLSVTDFSASDLRDSELQALGLSSAIVVPLASQTHTFGALAVYHHAPLAIDAEQRLLVEGLAHLVTGALARSRAQSAALEQQQFVEATIASMESMLLVVAADGTIQRTNLACQAITGFAAEDLVGRSISSSLLLPEELSAVKRALMRSTREKSLERFETYILTSDGLRRRIAWTAAPLPAASATGSSIVTGIDITDRCEAVERAARAEVLAQDARRLCNELQDRIKLGEDLLDGTAQSPRLPLGIEYDRRARSRRLYPYMQRIAPLRGTTMPDLSQFHEWMCYDISSRGFSFISATQPDYHKIVVAFGTPPALVYLTADIRHVTQREQNGRAQFVVGCRYTGRVSKKERPRGERGA